VEHTIIVIKLHCFVFVWCTDGKILVEDIVKLGSQAEEEAESDAE
jgi:hypothetical protein